MKLCVSCRERVLEDALYGAAIEARDKTYYADKTAMTAFLPAIPRQGIVSITASQAVHRNQLYVQRLGEAVDKPRLIPAGQIPSGAGIG